MKDQYSGRAKVYVLVSVVVAFMYLLGSIVRVVVVRRNPLQRAELLTGTRFESNMHEQLFPNLVRGVENHKFVNIQ